MIIDEEEPPLVVVEVVVAKELEKLGEEPFMY